MSGPGIGDLLSQAGEVQAKMARMQRELADKKTTGEAGGGMVVAVATGQLRIVEIKIEPALFASGDRDMIQDLTASAVNAALTAAQRMVQEEFQRISGGLMAHLPKGPGMPGSGSGG